MNNNVTHYHRDRFTWLAYLLLAFYGYFVNILGPITPFLKDELGLSYTVSSLHFSAFAAGMLAAGLGGHLIVQRIGRRRALWVGAFGLSLGAALLILGRAAPLTIGAAFLMSLVGSLILVIIPSALSDQHGEARAVAISEANVVASLFSMAAPLMVGWSISWFGDWRLALGLAALTALLLYFGFRTAIPAQAAAHEDKSAVQEGLPSMYWVYWVAILLGVSLEFCMVSWSADYLTKSLSLPRADAAQAVSIFLAAMIIGRWAASRLVRSFAARRVVLGYILTTAAGFALFWLTSRAASVLVGLFVTGLGIAGLYPLLLSMALGVSGTNTTQASARATLASGSAILALPLVLGRLADMVGIHQAYGVVIVLLVSLFTLVLAAGSRTRGVRL